MTQLNITENEKIHSILEYVCSADKDSFETDQIANAINLSLAEANNLVKQIIKNGDGKGFNDKDTSSKGTIGFLKITGTKDAYQTKKYLLEKMNYHFYFSTNRNEFTVFNISEQKVGTILDAYHQGKETFTISGEKYWINGLLKIKVFSSKELLNVEVFKEYCINRKFLPKHFFGTNFTPGSLAMVGEDVTEKLIGDSEYGGTATMEEEAVKDPHSNLDFINQTRLDELRNISNRSFDMTRLIKLCEEISDNFNHENYLTVGMIGRTIIHHIPPIFGFPSFDQVVSNYGGHKDNKSFKKNMENLNNSLKHIADRFLHQTIRNQEALPNATQVDFRQDMDVLLEEIVRKLKN